MFFRVKQSGPRQYLQIVENSRADGRVRQRVLTTLGRLDDLKQSGGKHPTLDQPDTGAHLECLWSHTAQGDISWLIVCLLGLAGDYNDFT